MMKSKLTLFVFILAAALFGVGCGSLHTTETSLKKGLVLHFPFDGNVKDVSGHEYNKNVKRFSWRDYKRPKLSTDRNGQTRKAYAFNDDDFINIGDTLPYKSSITVSAWINTKRKSEWVYIVAGEQTDFVFALNEGKLAFGGEGNNPFGPDIHSSTLLNDGQWRHAAASYNGTILKIYVDGVLENASKKSGVFKNTELYIGRARLPERRDERNMLGSIDDVRIYNRALSDEEVKALYDLEKPKTK